MMTCYLRAPWCSILTCLCSIYEIKKLEKMKKYIITVIVAIINLSIVSCGLQANPSETGNDHIASLPTDFIMGDTSAEINALYDETGGEWVDCNIHLEDYHSISGTYSEYVGHEIFVEWWSEVRKLDYDGNGKAILYDGCPYPRATVCEFIKHFSLSKEEFHDLWYYSSSYYTIDHEPDILFSGDAEIIEEYYSRDYDEYKQLMEIKQSEFYFLLDLFALYNDDPVYGESFGKVYDLGFNRFSIAQLIYEVDLPREKVEGIYGHISNNPEMSSYDFDFETIYAEKEAIMEAMKSNTPEEINNLVRSVDGIPCSDLSIQGLQEVE